MMKQLLASIALAISVAVLGYFGVGMSLESSVRQQLQRLADEDPIPGLEFGQSWFQDMAVYPGGSVTWKHVRIPFRRSDGELYRGGAGLLFTAASLKIGPSERPREYQIEAEGVGIQLDRGAGALPGVWRVDAYRGAGFAIERFSLALPMEDDEPGRAVRSALSKLAEVLTAEGASIPFQLVGRARIPVGGEIREVPLTVHEHGGRWSVQMDGEALRGAVGKLVEPLKAAELSYTNEYPLWAPVMIELRDYVRVAVSQARDQDPALPERAYAHLLWSYLLAREVGQGYSKEVMGRYIAETKANEAERQMDTSNSEVGRRFAADGVEQRRLIELAKTDPSVVRKTSSVRWSIK